MTQKTIEIADDAPSLESDRWLFIEFTPEGSYSMHASGQAMSDPNMLTNMLTQLVVNHVFNLGISAGARQMLDQMKAQQEKESSKPKLLLPR